jgi:hypothetical protein
MIWAKRHFSRREDYTPYQKRLADWHFLALSLQFVMVAKRSGRAMAGWDVYIGLPDELLLSQFEGFDLVDETGLPQEVDEILYAPNQGTGSEFHKHFRIVDSITGRRDP